MKRLILYISALLPLGASALELDANRAVSIALDNSEEVAAAVNAVEQAKANRHVARTAYLPNFSGSVTGGWHLPDSEYADMGMTLRMRGIYMAGVNVQQPIFAGGKILAANKMAKIGQDAAAEQLRLKRTQVAADAETSYWTYVAVLAKEEMMQSYAALVDTAYRQTLTSVDAGMATRNDLLRIEARRSQVLYQQEQVRAGANLCRMALCCAMGIATDTPLEVNTADIPADIPSNLGQYNLADRPEMHLLRADIAVKQQQVNMTRADFLPTLGLQAGWSAYGGISMDMATPEGVLQNKIRGNGWTIMFGLQVPIFHWGEGAKKVKAAKIDVENSRLNLQGTERKLDLQVQQAISNVNVGLQLVHSAETALQQATAALESTQVGYENGMNSITALLDAQSQWHSARSSLIEARTQLRIHVIDYRAATATLL